MPTIEDKKYTTKIFSIQNIKLPLQKNKQVMKQKTFPVSSEFIKKAHEVACRDWKDKLEQEFPSVFKASTTFRKGDKIKMPEEAAFSSNTYLLVCIGDDTMMLANMETGGRWSKPVKVKDVTRITPEEMDALIDGMYKHTQITVNGKKVEAVAKTPEQELYAKEEMIKDAHDEAPSQEIRDMIEKQFPEVFANPYVNLGHTVTIGTGGQYVDDVHMMIGDGIAPRRELERRCIVVDNTNCDVVIEHRGANTFIAFRKKGRK
jgi:hypothetical protein